MAVILDIGYAHFLLPESANVNLIIKSLSKARKMRRDYDVENMKYTYTYRDTEYELSLNIVSDADIIPAEKTKKLPPQPGLLFHAKDITTP
jgi:hypothetical protein